MKIASLETQAVDLTAAPEPIRGTPGESIATFVALTLRTDDGLEGIGYAGFTPPVVLPALKATLDGLAGLTLGMDPLETEKIQAKLLFDGAYGSPAGLVTRAASAIDVALWDICGKAHSQPLWKLLGGARRRVPAYASGRLWRTESLDEMAQSAARFVEQGFAAMKLRMGAQKSLSAELERLRVVREVVGPEVDLMVDINQGWDVDRAIAAGRAFDQDGLRWLEDPIHFEDHRGMRKIADALTTPVCAGEYSYGLATLNHLLHAGSVDVLMVDLMRAGGVTGWMKAAHMAESFNVPVVTHLAPEVMAHGAAACANARYVEHMPWSLPLFTEPPVVENGEIVLSDKPGLGLEFDRETIARFAA